MPLLRTVIAALGASMLASACGSLPNKTSVEALPSTALSAPNTGVVVLSAGAPQHCMSQATFLSVRHLSTKKVVESIPSIPVDVYVNKSDFTDHHGTVNAFQLVPGTYYLTPSMANPYVRNVKVPTFQFEVRAGETTYVGQLFMTQACALNTRYEVRDQYERDMRIAAQKNPAIVNRTPVKRLLTSGAPSGEN